MDMDRYIGRLLDGRYEILDVLGTGGMAVVYKARCHRLNRLVAIKILKDELTQDEEFRRRFHAESQAVAALSHPNIVSVYDVSTSDDADYIVMELIDGITLKQYMEKKGVLNWKETLHFAIQIGKALDHAHSRGIIHRDIKPHNVMVLKNGSVKVADFGIAQVMSKSNTLTKEALGSVHYISPEQAKGGRVDNRSDLYSLGVVMYEMMTGRPPYDGDTPVAVAIQHINGKAAMPSTLNPNMPGGLEQIIMKAMAQEPGKRYSTATQMLYDMDEFRKDPTILFDYNNSSTGLDDATMIHSTAAINAAAQTTAEKVVQKSGEQGARRTASNRQLQQKPKRKKRRREEIVEDVDRGGRVATVAVVICALVAIVAIGMFIHTLFGQDSGIDKNQDLITVPNLENKLYEEALTATDYVVKLDVYNYSDVFEKDRIISQEPAANTQIKKGETVYVVVSAGPEPTVKTMEDLIGLDQETAYNYLVKTQGVGEDLVAIVLEHNSEYEAGRVIRTDPVKGENLTDNEIIRLYVSKGPEVKRVKMVDLTSDFYNEESAIKWLEMNGFKNYKIQYVTSEMPEGKVIWQSEDANTDVDVTTPILIQVSQGSQTQPTVPPRPTMDPEDYVSKLVDVVLPEDAAEDYLVSIYRLKDGVLVEERDIPAGTMYTQFVLTGKGVMQFEVQLSTGEKWTIDVDFDAPYVPYEPPVEETPVVPDEPVISDDENGTDTTDPTENTDEVVTP